MYAKTVKK